MAHELNWTAFMGHKFPMKHHIIETYQESSMMEPRKRLMGHEINIEFYLLVMKNV